MYRIRLQLPPGVSCGYQNLDLIHDALVNAWIAAGATPKMIIGAKALPWNFAPLGKHYDFGNRLHTLVVSAGHPDLVRYLAAMNPAEVCKDRRHTKEHVDFSKAMVQVDPDPIARKQGHLKILLLSPLAIRTRTSKKHWHVDMHEAPLTKAVNTRLSRLSERTVQLEVIPDRLYLRANPKHSVLIHLKRFPNGKTSFAIGMTAPLTLAGSDEDLRLAWYAGLGEKTRNGFGCIGLLDNGVGR